MEVNGISMGCYFPTLITFKVTGSLCRIKKLCCNSVPQFHLCRRASSAYINYSPLQDLDLFPILAFTSLKTPPINALSYHGNIISLPPFGPPFCHRRFASKWRTVSSRPRRSAALIPWPVIFLRQPPSLHLFSLTILMQPRPSKLQLVALIFPGSPTSTFLQEKSSRDLDIIAFSFVCRTLIDVYLSILNSIREITR